MPRHYNYIPALYNAAMKISVYECFTPSNEINITPGSPNRGVNGQRRLNININIAELKFQYLRIEMRFYDNSECMDIPE